MKWIVFSTIAFFCLAPTNEGVLLEYENKIQEAVVDRNYKLARATYFKHLKFRDQNNVRDWEWKVAL